MFSYPSFFSDVSAPDEAFVLHRIAFYYFCVVGVVWVIVVGLIVSFLTGPRDPDDMNRDLFVTFIHKYVTFKDKRHDIRETEMLNVNYNRHFINEKEIADKETSEINDKILSFKNLSNISK